MVEMAFLLPVLLYMGLGTMDFGRALSSATIVANAARNGAVYLADPVAQAISPYSDVTAAALADATNLSPSPTVTSTTGTDGTGMSYAEVTVNWTFQTTIKYPGVPTTTTISRTVRMSVAPIEPN